MSWKLLAPLPLVAEKLYQTYTGPAQAFFIQSHAMDACIIECPVLSPNLSVQWGLHCKMTRHTIFYSFCRLLFWNFLLPGGEAAVQDWARLRVSPCQDFLLCLHTFTEAVVSSPTAALHSSPAKLNKAKVCQRVAVMASVSRPVQSSPAHLLLGVPTGPGRCTV